jgi:hypothetical protein
MLRQRRERPIELSLCHDASPFCPACDPKGERGGCQQARSANAPRNARGATSGDIACCGEVRGA